MHEIDMWSYRTDERDDTGNGGSGDLTGYSVEALDGSIGKVDEASNVTAGARSWSTPGRGSSARRCSSRPA